MYQSFIRYFFERSATDKEVNTERNSRRASVWEVTREQRQIRACCRQWASMKVITVIGTQALGDEVRVTPPPAADERCRQAWPTRLKLAGISIRSTQWDASVDIKKYLFSSTSFASPCRAPHATEMSFSSLDSANRSQQLFSRICHKLFIQFSTEINLSRQTLFKFRPLSVAGIVRKVYIAKDSDDIQPRTILWQWQGREYRCKYIQVTASVARNCNTMCSLFCNTLHRRQLAPVHSTDNFNYISK